MDRDEALAYLNSTMDALMTSVSRLLTDSAGGYGPALDAAFSLYILKNELLTDVTDTDVEAADTYCFQLLLIATVYDLILPAVAATKVDFSVDAPLASIKFSQSYRALWQLRNDAWAQASACGNYGYSIDNVGGFKIALDFNEPASTYGSSEF